MPNPSCPGAGGHRLANALQSQPGGEIGALQKVFGRLPHRRDTPWADVPGELTRPKPTDGGRFRPPKALLNQDFKHLVKITAFGKQSVG
jgi:hypothetical protein